MWGVTLTPYSLRALLQGHGCPLRMAAEGEGHTVKVTVDLQCNLLNKAYVLKATHPITLSSHDTHCLPQCTAVMRKKFQTKPRGAHLKRFD